eukprot:scaffold13228_cov112-Isochrysis_galbana.AAC.4
MSEYCRSVGTGSVIPQSKMHSSPSGVRSRLPGCGSQCSTPVSSSMVMYALMATPHSRGTSGDASRSSRVPSTHRVTSTLDVDNSGSTSGAVTAPRPRSRIAVRNAVVERACGWGRR